MPKQKRTKSTHKTIDATTEYLAVEPSLAHVTPPRSRRRTTMLLLVVVVLLALVLAVRNGFVVAALVNGRPIFWWDLTRALHERFGSQTLEGMISQHVIEDAAKSGGVTVTAQDVEKREAEIMSSVGTSADLADLLRLQGMTKEQFDSQVRLQLAVERLVGKDIEITPKDVDMYIATNRARFTATTEAELKEEARKTLFEMKLGEKLQPWFREVREKATVYTLL